MKYIYIIFVLFILSSCINNELNRDSEIISNNNNEINSQESVSFIENNKLKFLEWDYYWVIESLEKSEIDTYESNILLAESYLNYWNAYYDESKNSEKALLILNNMEDDFYVLFLKWYANEIIKNYDDSLKYYYEALNIDWLSNDEKSVAYNQIWHISQLMWFSQEAYNFYQKAYELNKNNVSINLNIWRSLIHSWDLIEGKKYFENALSLTDNTFLKSEIYYWLSSIVLNSSDYNTTTDIYNIFEKSLEYADKSLTSNSNYPLAYVWYARALILLNKDLDIAEDYLNKSIELYPNLSVAYKYLWYLNMNQNNYKDSIVNFNKSLDLLSDDITLMWYERNNKWELYFQISYSYAKLWDKINSLEYLKNTINAKSKYTNNLLFKELLKENNWVFVILKWNDYFDNLLKLLNINKN